MKKILLAFAFFLSAALASAQQVDTVKLYNKSGLQIGFVTTPKVVADTIRVSVPCDTAKTTTTAADFGFTLYVGSEFATIFNDPVKGLELKKYLKDYGYTGVSYYGLGLIPSTQWAALRAFNKDLRVNYGIKFIEATASSAGTFANERTQFNAGCASAQEKFDCFNMEREFWNAKDASGAITAASVQAAWNLDSVEWKKAKAAADAAGVKFVWYQGWPIKNQKPLHQVRNESAAWFHIYKATPDTTYGAYRWIDANTAQKEIAPGVKLPVTIGVSAESAFMQAWFKTHTLAQLRAILEPCINKFSNLKLTNIQVFMYSEIKAAQPPKTIASPAAALRVATQFNTGTTSPSHLETAIER